MKCARCHMDLQLSDGCKQCRGCGEWMPMFVSAIDRNSEVARLKQIIAKELVENDELGSEFTYVVILKDLLREARALLVGKDEHDEDCMDAGEEFGSDESCECGAVMVKRFLDNLRSARVD